MAPEYGPVILSEGGGDGRKEEVMKGSVVTESGMEIKGRREDKWKEETLFLDRM